MTYINKSDPLDTQLLQQYFELLGREGLQQSLDTFTRLMPSYMSELQSFAAAKREDDFRRQAHKVKGGCRSLGFARLGHAMQYLEKEAWQWNDVEKVLNDAISWLETDRVSAQAWLEEQSAP